MPGRTRARLILEDLLLFLMWVQRPVDRITKNGSLEKGFHNYFSVINGTNYILSTNVFMSACACATAR